MRLQVPVVTVGLQVPRQSLGNDLFFSVKHSLMPETTSSLELHTSPFYGKF